MNIDIFAIIMKNLEITMNLSNLLASGYTFKKDEYELKLKYIIFNSLLLFNIILVGFATYMRIINNDLTIAMYDSFYLLSATATFFLARHKKTYFDKLVYFVLFFSLAIVSIIFYTNLNPLVGTSWFAIVFMIAIVLSHKKEVIFVFIISLFLIIFISVTKHNHTPIEIFIGCMPYLLMVFFIYFFQIRNQDIKNQLKIANDFLNDSLDSKTQELLKFQKIIDKSAVSIIISDKDGNIEYINPYFEEITGYSKEEIVGKNSRILKSDIHTDKYYKTLWDDITNNKTWNGTFKNINKAGEEYWESAMITPVYDKNGEISNFVAIKQEITQQIYLENKLLKQDKDKVENFEKTLESFVQMVEQRDTYTAGHSSRVAKYSKLIAQEMGYSKEECELLYRASILHDIGKVATPDNILLKPGKLSKFEYTLIQEHVLTSYEILKDIPMYKNLAEIIKSHHERYDGKGYPDGLKEDEIHPLSQIMIVADAFDAMTTNRIYQGRKSVDEAIKEVLICSGTQFHPKVAQAVTKALQNVKLHGSINQLPVTDLEKERFSYFYRDQATMVYNSTYLEFMLNQNKFDKKYTSLILLNMHNFHQYNKKYGWVEGDRLLKDFALFISSKFPSTHIFKIYGNDFVLLSEEKIVIDLVKCNEVLLLKENNITITMKYVNLKENDYFDLKDLYK